MSDPTEATRREMLRSGQPYQDLAEALRDKGEIWDTDALRRDFEVHSFLAPFCMVTRKSDGARGTLEFVHNPRFYFNFAADVKR